MPKHLQTKWFDCGTYFKLKPLWNLKCLSYDIILTLSTLIWTLVLPKIVRNWRKCRPKAIRCNWKKNAKQTENWKKKMHEKRKFHNIFKITQNIYHSAEPIVLSFFFILELHKNWKVWNNCEKKLFFFYSYPTTNHNISCVSA